MENPRLGKCYELSGEYVIMHPEQNAVLVHGSIQLEGKLANPHAWVELPDTGMIHDPVMDWTLPYDAWMRYHRAKVFARYTQKEAAKLMIETGHYGSWDEESDRCREAFINEIGE